MGEEIRRRLEASFAGAVPAAPDEPTARLLREIARIASGVRESYDAPWCVYEVQGAAFELSANRMFIDSVIEALKVLDHSQGTTPREPTPGSEFDQLSKLGQDNREPRRLAAVVGLQAVIRGNLLNLSRPEYSGTFMGDKA